MGFYYDATAVLGVRIPLSRLKREEKVRGCGCAAMLPEVAAKFCPSCGKPLWITRTSFIPECKPSDGARCPVEAVAGMPATCGTGEDDWVFVGQFTPRVRQHSQPWCQMLEVSGSVEDLRQKLRAALEPLGLWVESQFGLWAVLGGG